MSFRMLTIANLKMHMRNRSSLFWHFAFPLIFMVLFGLIFSGGVTSPIRVGMVDTSLELGEAFNSAFAEIDNATLVEGEKDELIDDLKNGGLDAVIVLDESTAANSLIDVEIFYDQTENLTGGMARSFIISLLDQIRMQAFAVPELFDVTETSVARETLSYMSFLMPGVIGMSIMFSALFGTSYPLVMEREKGILRRLRLTLVTPVSFIGAKTVGLLAIAFMQAAIIIITGILFFDVQIVGSLWAASFVVLIGCLMMVALGLLVAGLANRLESVDAIANSIGMPMMFLAGTFFPVDGAPRWLQTIATVLPLTYLNDALREILVTGSTLVDVSNTLLIIVAWTVVFFAFAIYLFKWEVNYQK
ncbi:ABC transporter permease [Dethiobacter alkaliphilus]|uniref:ABC transporter permease n=1 Tax=Dethiobacter alkaliphilus TaxID=427926 RepID=UPI002226B589|nr:ABC transporter permease [Dethiobacter alkaliphilus]MCW3490374.1 ABC transporter permease [Dethiobacter alkaliphilus]